MKMYNKGLLAAAVASAMFSMTSIAAADCPVKVGVAYPTSVDWGKPIAETALWVAELMNEAGGVDGCQVETILRDTQTDPKVGVDAAKSMVDLDKVQLLIGAVSSGVTLPILTSVTAPAGVMQMSCCSSSTKLTAVAREGTSKGLWFRTFATSNIPAAVAAMQAKASGYKNIAIFYKNDDWGQDIGGLAAEAFKAVGIDVVSQVAITDGQPSYRAQVTEVLATNPEAVYLALYPTEGISVVREWISLGGTTKMIAANALKSDEFRDAVGMKYLGDLAGIDNASPRVDSAAAFKESYKAHFGSEPNGPGLANSFDAAAIALLAYHAAGKDATGAEIAAKVAMVTDPNGEKVGGDVAGLKKAIQLLSEGESVSFQGGTGGVVFDQYGDVSAPAVVWAFTEDGIEEKRYLTLQEVNDFMASIK